MQERAPENMSDNRCNSIMCFETSKHPIKFMHLCTASPCRHLKQKERRIELTQKSSVTPSIRARVLEIRESKERERETWPCERTEAMERAMLGFSAT